MKGRARQFKITQQLADLSPDAINALGQLYGGDQKCIEAVKALDGRIFATLTKNEDALLNFYRNQGRKWGVSVSIINEADPIELSTASSQQHADQIMKSANSRVSVSVIGLLISNAT